MAATVQHTFRVALTAPPGHRRDVDADGATVSVKLLDANGAPTGPNLVIIAAGALTSPPLLQYAPGKFTLTSTGAPAPFTRGARYRATYTIDVGGVTVQTVTQDFTAFSDALHLKPAEQHLYTTGAMRNIARRALGIAEKTATQAGDEPGGSNSLDIVNDGLEDLWGRHRWTWQLAEPWYFDLVPGIDRVLLPEDYMETKSLQRRGASMTNFVEQDLEWIARAREKSPSHPGHVIYYAVVADPPHEASGLIRYALEIFPPPAAGGYVQDAGVLHYYRTCPKVCTDADLIPFPRGFHQLAKLAVRAEAFESEGENENADRERAKLEAKLGRAVAQDARHGPQSCGSMIRTRARPDDEHTGHDPYAAIDPPPD